MAQSELLEADNYGQWTTSSWRAAGIEAHECSLVFASVRFGEQFEVEMELLDVNGLLTFLDVADLQWSTAGERSGDRPLAAAGDVDATLIEDDLYVLDSIDGRFSMRAVEVKVQVRNDGPSPSSD